MIENGDLQNTLKYKFMKALINKQHSKNSLERNISSGIMNSMSSMHNLLGDKTREKEADELKKKLENDDRNKRKVKNIMKQSIDKYTEKCLVLSEDDQKDMITILLDTILRRVEGQSNEELKNSLKYITKITELACNVTREEHKLLLQEYSNYLKNNDEDKKRDFLLNLFKEIKARHPTSRKGSKVSSRKGSLLDAFHNLNIHSRRSSRISDISNVPTIRNSSSDPGEPSY
jgi:hypothetical protein